MVRRKPIIAIVGATGTGKSKLGIELAQKFNGEVINADALQVYKGLDISTNKVTEEEMTGVRHHLLSFQDVRLWHRYRDTHMKDYTIVDFIKDATAAIDDIHARGKLPIVVGGTHYYVQRLLWQDEHLEDALSATQQNIPTQKESIINLSEFERLRIKELLDTNDHDAIYQELQRVDPIMLTRWHRNDTRKIKRSLEVYYESGQQHSQLLSGQQTRFTERYPAVVFCMYSDNVYLHPRLDTRVDLMFERGLHQELIDVHQKVVQTLAPDLDETQDLCDVIDISRGVLQSIGYKEFRHYLHKYPDSTQSDIEQIDDLQQRNMFMQSVELMKQNTRTLAKMQLKWIKHKMAPVLHKVKTPFYILDVQEASRDQWDKILNFASSVVAKFEDNDDQLPNVQDWNGPLQEALLSKSVALEDECKYFKESCTACDKVIHGRREWEIHLSSRKHKSALRRSNNPRKPYVKKVSDDDQSQKNSN
ncbi:hypothetical protein MIR68_011600 [Amoeboaphelidium protococcarum]|nr:hypothetical protein MIR68_011600 [Amoeboaphelidium protococcarum]